MKIRALLVDDEPHAREGIRIRLKEYRNIRIVGECSSGSEAVSSINTLHPDLLFLDIQMPEMNGFEVLQKITVTPLPIVIFVTAYDTYAIKAFECHALDYLLKPISDDRFKEALHVARVEIKHRNLELYADKLKSVASDYLALVNGDAEQRPLQISQNVKRYLNRLTIKFKDQIFMIPVHEIDWIEAAGDYVYVHAKSQKHIVRETLLSLEQRLDPAQFIRIHRSAIVNVEKIKSFRPNKHGDYDVYLQSGIKLKLSRTYRIHFQKVTGNLL